MNKETKSNIGEMLPQEVERVLKKYTDVEPSSINPVSKDIKQEVISGDFVKATDDYYKDTKYILPYKNGFAIGQYGSTEENFKVFLDRLKNGIKEIITDELRTNGQTTEHLSSTYKLVDNTFDILTEKVYNNSNNKVEVDVKSLAAKLHGFVNGYIKQLNIKED